MAARRASDASSGLNLKREAYPNFSDDEVERNFVLFKHYDLDNSGFITAENLLEVLKALDMDVSIESAHGMIDEVAQLTGHENDGQLSFRDYMAMAFHDRQASAETTVTNVAEESTEGLAIEEPESPVGCPAPAPETPVQVAKPAPAPPLAKRRSSMSALNALASGRIKAFQQVADDAKDREKLNKFKKQPVEVSGPMVNSEDMHLQNLQSKLKAFEVAAHYKGQVELRKTWKKVGGASNYHSSNKILLAGAPAGVAPKKKLSDLP